MPLGRKLFLSFFSLSVAGIFLFAYVAYKNTHTIQLEELLEMNKSHAEHIAKISRNATIATLQQWADTTEQTDSGKHHHIFFVDKNRNVLASNVDIHVDDWPQYNKFIHHEQDNGYATVNNEHYIWSRVSLDVSPISVVIIHEIADTSFIGYLSAIKAPLFFTALILLWSTTWASIILTNLYNRLDKQRQALEYQATHDQLTDLPNRNYLVKQIEHHMQANEHEDEMLALMIVDINRLSEINDSLGHTAGDNLLKMIAERIRKQLRDTDILSRVVSDEFAILLPSTNQQATNSIANRIHEQINNGFELEEHELYIGANIGIAFYPEHAVSAIDLIKHAELAMYAAKKTGTGYSVFDKAHKINTLEHLALVKDLRTDIDNEHLTQHYQPKVDLLSGEVVSLEALARWHHPDHGNVAPGRFIHVAENTGMITPLSYWAITTAIQTLSDLHKKGHEVDMAINLSVWNLQDKNIIQHISHCLANYKIAPKFLTLEITETAMMVNQKRAINTLNNISKLGINISIDDFGTGYSSLSYLKRLPVNEVKIDRSFVKGMTEDNNGNSVVKAIIDIAHDLKLNVVAEGIENEATAKMLLNMGCDIGQGFYYAQPMSFVDLQEYLANSVKLNQKTV